MAVANDQKLLCRTNMSTHFGRKEDEVCSQLIVIEDIKSKIGSSKPGEGLASGKLECGGMKISVKIYPNGMDVESVGNISIKVLFDNHGKRQWKSIETLFAENSTGASLKTRTSLLEELLKLKGGEGFEKGFVTKEFLTHDILLAEENSSFFPKGALTVKVNIKIQGEETVTVKITKLPEESISSSQLKGELSVHLKKMLESHQFTDFKIICQGEIIPCHRSILAARSDVFEAMFEHNMVENITGETEIIDFDLETVKAVLIHIYTGEIKDAGNNAEQIIRAADKYQLHGLKKKTEDILIKALKIENAIDMFVLGDAAHAVKLRDVSKDFVVKNAVAIVETDEGWKEKLGRFHELALEIFESVVKSKAHT